MCCCTLQQHPHQHHPPLTDLWRRVAEQRRSRVRFRGTFTQRDRERSNLGLGSATWRSDGERLAASGSSGMLSASLKRLTKLKRGGSLKEF